MLNDPMPTYLEMYSRMRLLFNPAKAEQTHAKRYGTQVIIRILFGPNFC